MKMIPLIRKHRSLLLLSILILLVILLQIFLLKHQKNVNEIEMLNYISQIPDPTVAERTISSLIEGLKDVTRESKDTTLFSTYLFSYYPKPRVNLTSFFNASKKAFSNGSTVKDLVSLKDGLNKVERKHCSKMALIGGWSCETRIDGAKPICLTHIYPANDCLVYSFGVGHDFSFEKAMGNYGCQVFVFDDDDVHSYNNVVDVNVYFFKIRLGTIVQALEVNDIVNKKKYRLLYRPLDNIMYVLKHEERPIDVLKLDIEGDEWKVLKESLCKGNILNRTKQLVLETHLDVLANYSSASEELLLKNISYYNQVIQCLSDHHFVLVASVPNEIRATFTVVKGLIFHLYQEQLWINTRFDNRGNPRARKQDLVPKNIELTSQLLEE